MCVLDIGDTVSCIVQYTAGGTVRHIGTVLMSSVNKMIPKVKSCFCSTFSPNKSPTVKKLVEYFSILVREQKNYSYNDIFDINSTFLWWWTWIPLHHVLSSSRLNFSLPTVIDSEGSIF